MTRSYRPEVSSPKDLRVDVREGIATVSVERPEVANALDRATCTALLNAFLDFERRDDVDVVIVSGAGERAFVAGADLRELRVRRRDDALASISSTVYSAIERCRKPVIAAINGAARGGGCELALACDLRIAADHATFSLPELSLGIIPAAGATQRLPRIIGLGRAKLMILTGERIDAPTALAWGLVSSVVPAAGLMDAARQLAVRLRASGPLALRLAKTALLASSRADLETGLLIESLAQAICFESDDKREGVAAFLEKRAPRFRST
jgi:enoyl-CoA hydratase